MKPSNFKRIHALTEKALQFNFAVGSGRIYAEGLTVSKSANCPEEDKPLSFQTWYTRHATTGAPIPTDVVTAADASVVVDEYNRENGVRIRARKGEGENNFTIEHFKGSQLLAKKIVKGKHGGFCTGDQFSAKPLSFHPTLPRVAYLAEAIAPTADLFTSKFDPKNLAGNEYRHHYGENLSDVYYLGIYVYDYQKQKVFKLKGLPEDVSITSVAYLPDAEEKLLVTFLDDKHKLLPGLSMCMNKESKIYILSDLEFEDLTPDEAEQEALKEKKAKDKEAGIKEEPAKLTKKLISNYPLVMFPSASPSGKKITYFYRDSWIDTHLFNTGLVVYDVESGETTEVVSCNEPSNEVRSLYAYYDAHSKFIWTSETEIVFPSFDLGRSVLNFINIETKTRRHVHLHCHFETDNVSILDITDNLLLLALNNYYFRSRIALVENWQKWRTEDPKPEDYLWEPTNEHDALADHVLVPGSVEEVKISSGDATGFVWYLKDFKDEEGKEVPLSKRPLLIDFHGGPHYFSSANYSTLKLVVLKFGWQIMSLNFSGSWSFGAEFNQRLCGQIGKIDIQELINWLDSYKGNYDEDNLVFDGGSYSGLQSIVVYREHHKRFRGVIAYNPVVNLFSTLYQTDIPDWSSVEGLGASKRFDIGQDFTDAELLKLRDLSPALLPFDPETKSKLLFVIGDSDKRVPPPGALYLYRKLKALGLDVRYLSYKGQGHGIRKPKFVFDYLLNSFAFIFDLKEEQPAEK